MSSFRDAYNYPIWRTELDDMLDGIVLAAVAAGADGEFRAGYLAAVNALAATAGLHYRATGEVPTVTVKVARRLRLLEGAK